MNSIFTSRFETVKFGNGFKFRFYCDMCNFYFETAEIQCTSYMEALNRGQNEAKQYFNKCHTCEKWVCDNHYNESEMNCIICSPVAPEGEKQACPSCGHVNDASNRFCSRCGKAI